VPPVARRDDVHLSGERSSEHQVVSGVSADGLHLPQIDSGALNGELGQDDLRLSQAFGGEVSFRGEDPPKLDEHGLGQDQADTSGDRFLQKPARRAVGYEGRDEDVRVEDDPQAQDDSRRTSSTSASTSSGPMPRSSAHARPYA
jgi:hypothetical protein